MTVNEYNIHDVYQELLQIKHQVASIESFGTEALKLAEKLTGHLELLEGVTSFNFRRESQYKSVLKYDAAADLNSWKAKMSQYTDEGFVSITEVTGPVFSVILGQRFRESSGQKKWGHFGGHWAKPALI